MPEALFVAAGGGGDAIAATLLAKAMGLGRQDAIVATMAWERLLIDPVPGPRTVDDFAGLGSLGRRGAEILPTTTTSPPGRSALPRLSSELAQRIAFLEATHGAVGLADQISDLAETLTGSQRVFLVDVGGDVLARGTEPGLRSPLGDALTLAACTRLDDSIEVLIAGPALDGELTDGEVSDRLRSTSGVRGPTLGTESTSDAMTILEWHPSEATALLVAVSRGIEGVAEIRDAGIQVHLSASGRSVWSVTAAAAARESLGGLLQDSTSLEAAEETIRGRVGATELDYERRKAGTPTAPSTATTHGCEDWSDAVDSFEASAASRGTDYTTFRRIAEAVGAPGAFSQIRNWLTTTDPNHFEPPLWRVRQSTRPPTARL